MAFDFKYNLGVVENSVASLDYERYSALREDCLSALHAGRKIIVSGLGKNVPVCEKFVSSMRSVGLEAEFLHTSEAFHGDLGMVKEGDVVIILSKSGKTPESLLLADKLRTKRRVILWAFTFEYGTDLSDRVNNAIVLSLEQEGGPWNIMPMNSTVVSLFILQGLIIDLVNAMGIKLSDFKTNHPGGGIGKKLQAENAERP